MSNDPNDYRLPPFPKDYQGLSRDWLDYGHACAEHVRVPLLARIAELEAEAVIIRNQRERFGAERIRLLDDRDRAKEVSDRLRAELAAKAGEVEKLRADKARIEEVQNDHLRIEPFEMRTPGGDDADVGWRIYSHHQQAPRLREVACHYADDLRAAIDAAIAARKGASREADEGAEGDQLGEGSEG